MFDPDEELRNLRDSLPDDMTEEEKDALVGILGQLVESVKDGGPPIPKSVKRFCNTVPFPDAHEDLMNSVNEHNSLSDDEDAQVDSLDHVIGALEKHGYNVTDVMTVAANVARISVEAGGQMEKTLRTVAGEHPDKLPVLLSLHHSMNHVLAMLVEVITVMTSLVAKQAKELTGVNHVDRKLVSRDRLFGKSADSPFPDDGDIYDDTTDDAPAFAESSSAAKSSDGLGDLKFGF